MVKQLVDSDHQLQTQRNLGTYSALLPNYVRTFMVYSVASPVIFNRNLLQLNELRILIMLNLMNTCTIL